MAQLAGAQSNNHGALHILDHLGLTQKHRVHARDKGQLSGEMYEHIFMCIGHSSQQQPLSVRISVPVMDMANYTLICIQLVKDLLGIHLREIARRPEHLTREYLHAIALTTDITLI